MWGLFVGRGMQQESKSRFISSFVQGKSCWYAQEIVPKTLLSKTTTTSCFWKFQLLNRVTDEDLVKFQAWVQTPTERSPSVWTWVKLTVRINVITQRRRNTIWQSLYVESKKKWYKGTYKTERDSQTFSKKENKLLVAGGGGSGGRDKVREFGMTYTHCYI